MSDNLDTPLEFSLKRKERQVLLQNPQSGEKELYVLRELDGVLRDAYMEELGKRMKFNNEGKSAGLSSFKGLQSGLLSKGLYKDDMLVPESTILLWPASVINALAEELRKLSGLDEQAEDKAKND